MSNPHKENAQWAQENGYEYHAGSNEVIPGCVLDLGASRYAEGYRDHVLGIYRNRPFEILDLMVEVRSSEGAYRVWRTIVVIPTAGLGLPNFELVSRREARGLNFLGVKGLDLKVNPLAPRDEQQLVDAFNKNYHLFGEGAIKAMEALIKSADHLVPSLAEIASICKPSVLRFLSTAVTGGIEVLDGRMAIQAPETRIIGPGISDTILQGKERESLLNVANELLDVFANAASETPLRALTLENTLRPAQFLGSIIGTAIGFFAGLITSIILFIVFKGEYFYLLPLLIFGGVVLGRFIGNFLTPSNDPLSPNDDPVRSEVTGALEHSYFRSSSRWWDCGTISAPPPLLPPRTSCGWNTKNDNILPSPCSIQSRTHDELRTKKVTFGIHHQMTHSTD